ncbi:hypothetical protein JTB14_012035 [Gonioctena quinquepunctata]|nr:hypothetical protein JTB14_012035 [Gonioctena quinquepunctata]
MEICQIDLNKLRSAGMITMDHNVNITPTKTGEIMAKYYVAFETMKLFTQISGTEILTQILALVSKCHEFSELRLRVNDKKTLNLLNKNSKKDTIRFPLNGRIKTADMKVNCTIQAVLGNLDISDQSILGDSFTIMRNGQRIVKCLIDYLGTRGKNCYSALLNSIILGKCFHAKLWENSPFVSKQLTGIGSVLSTLLVNAGKTSFAKIAESNPRDIELIVKKRLPMGDNLIEEVQHIPTYTMTLEKLAESKSIQLRLTIQLKNLDYLQEKSTIHLKSAMSLLVGNNLNEILVYERYQHSYMMENPLLTKVFEVEVVTDLEKIEAHFISEDWVGIDCYSDILIDNNIQKTDQSSKKLQWSSD